MNADVIESIIQTHLPAASQGDKQAYGRIVQGCQNTVTSIALAIVRDVPASEDIAQEAFISAWQQLKKLNNASSFLPWLRQITRNLSLDYLRAQKFRANPAGDIEAMMLSVTDPAPGPSEAMAAQEDAKIAAAVIDTLPEECREIVLLYYREGQSTQQVASLLGMQDAAVRKRLSRARQIIREQLLQRTGNFVKATAPSIAFTTVVTTALAISAPPVATASVVATAATGGSIAGKGMLGLSLGAIGTFSIGLFSGLFGVWGGLAHLLVKPFDEKEKRGLIAYGVINSLIALAFTAALFFVKSASDSTLILTCMAFVSSLLLCTFLWLPRILKRRTEYDRLHPDEFDHSPETKGFIDNLKATYSKSPTGKHNRLDNMHYWMTGMPPQLMSPFDEQEKRELVRYVAGTGLMVVGFIAGMMFILKSELHIWLWTGIWSIAFMAAMTYSVLAWLPRILARRKAAEKARYPVAFERRERKEKTNARIGLFIGIGMGSLGLIIGLLSSV